MWATLAADDGDRKAKALRDYLEKDMKPAEIAAAKKAAEACKASKFQKCN